MRLGGRVGRALVDARVGEGDGGDGERRLDAAAAAAAVTVLQR